MSTCISCDSAHLSAGSSRASASDLRRLRERYDSTAVRNNPTYLENPTDIDVCVAALCSLTHTHTHVSLRLCGNLISLNSELLPPVFPGNASRLNSIPIGSSCHVGRVCRIRKLAVSGAFSRLTCSSRFVPSTLTSRAR